MSDDLPPRRNSAVPTRLLSVIGVVGVGLVVGSLLIWHADMFGSADKEPVVSSVSAPAIGGPPKPATTKVTLTPSRPTKTAKPKPTTSPKPAQSGATSVSEESIDGLSPRLKARLKKAMVAARADGVTIKINSGRRSAAKQQKLLNEAIKKYGSYKAATHWVLPPKDSAHVQGKAVDITPAAAWTWLNQNGWRYGVCRRYDNEPWHFEALTTPGTKCPPREPHAVAKSD
jgi:D-alanyl-D-alanine carboxypeptidase